jgi:cytochrome c oxidase cbb3-type subunit 1
MKYAFETIAVGIGAFLALLGVAFAKDDLFEAHMWVLFFVLLVSTVLLLRRIKFSTASGETADDQSGYFDEVVRYGIIATTFWGIVGFLVGVVVAFQLAYPDLNIEPWLNFGRTRPLHTSAVIFAFGGNACWRPVLRGPAHLAGAAVWRRSGLVRVLGLSAVHRDGGDRLSAGHYPGPRICRARMVCRPVADRVWVAYLAVFMGTLVKRKEPHIYVANWFYLAFIVTIAMLHVVNNLAVPVSFLGTKSYSAFAGVQDALTQWWYGHNAVGFFLTAGFLGMMYYFIPKQANRPVYSYRLSIITSGR